MNERPARRTNLFLALALIFLTAPVALTQSPAATTPPNATSAAAPLAFDAISIRPSKSTTTTTNNGIEIERMFTRTTPDGYSVENATLKYLIMEAYSVKWDSIIGGPGWIASDHFDIEAKVTPAADAPPPKLTSAQRKQMIQSLLANRFNLVVHNETKDAPIYELGLAKSGSKLPISTSGDTFAKGFKGIDDNPVPIGYPVLLSFGHLFGQAVTIASLIDYMTSTLHRPIVDKTGLTGKYDLSLEWTPDNTPDDSPLAGGPSLFTAVQEQLGLKLISTHGSVKTLVIDHIERPSPN
jgi:uncharacterized protein (TIGR03435 family)